MVLFIEKITETMKKYSASHNIADKPTPHETENKKDYPAHSYKILCIGASTGGPTAVQEVLKGLGKNFPLPILYVQHIDTGSDQKMVSWFNSTCPDTPMELAKDGQIAQKGHVYMAPADKHLVIDFINKDGKPVLSLAMNLQKDSLSLR